MLPGIYVSIVKNGSPETLTIAPYSDQFGFTCTQKWFRPIEEFFNAAKGIIQSTASTTGGIGNVAVGGIETVAQGFRLFGVQLFNKAFMAKAWEGTEPIDLGLNLKFFFGMYDKWSGLEEVYKPIMRLMGNTVPKNGDIIITSPGPTAIDVYAKYAGDIFRGLLKTILDIAPTRESLSTEVNNADNVPGNRGTIGRTWRIEVGYSSDGKKIQQPFYVLNNLIVTSSSFNFSPEVDTDGAPINGTIKMNFTAQTLTVDTDFLQQPLYIRQG